MFGFEYEKNFEKFTKKKFCLNFVYNYFTPEK